MWSSESILLFSLLNGWLRDAVEGGSVLELGGGLTGLCGLGLAFSGKEKKGGREGGREGKGEGGRIIVR